jgi:SRSO17 transposase
MPFIPDFNPDLLKLVGISETMLPSIISTLHDYLLNYKDCFNHIKQFEHFCIYFKGLMSYLDRKSIEPIALHFGGPALVQPLQLFMTR